MWAGMCHDCIGTIGLMPIGKVCGVNSSAALGYAQQADQLGDITDGL